MDTVTNALKVAGAIVAFVYLFKWLADYCKNKESKSAQVDAENIYQRLYMDIQECTTIHSLKRIERCIPVEMEKIKCMIPDSRKYEILLKWEVSTRLIQLYNDYFKKTPQQELIFLLKN